MRFLKPIDGDVLFGPADGRITEGKLLTTVTLQAMPGSSVRINGVEAVARDGVFSAEITLEDCRNRVEAVDLTTGERVEMVIYWFRHGYHTYRLGVDDVIWSLENIWRNQNVYTSIFDDPFFALYRDLHEKYGTPVHMHIYYRNEDGSFDLSMFPDKYRKDFQANWHWLKLSFHSLTDEPARPYLHASYEQVLREGQLVCNEIRRFTGIQEVPRVTSQHWCECPPEVCHAFRDLGYDCMDGYFRYDRHGVPVASFYFDNDMVDHLADRDFWVSHSDDVLYVKDDIIINEVPLAKINAQMDAICGERDNCFLYLLIHEQYFYEKFPLYEPDYRERIFATVDWCHRHGYAPETITAIMEKSGWTRQNKK